MSWMMAAHFSSLPLPRHLETQERELLAKLEPGGWAKIGLILQRQEDPIPQGQKCQIWTKSTMTLRPQYQLKHVTDLDCHALIVSRVLCILHPKSQTDPTRTGTALKIKQKKRLTY